MGAALERAVSQILVGLVGVALRQNLGLGDVAVIRFPPFGAGDRVRGCERWRQAGEVTDAFVIGTEAET